MDAGAARVVEPREDVGRDVALADPGTDGIYVLGGDQEIAMRVLSNTPAETAITAAAQQRGVVLGGTSAFLWLAHELSLAQQAAAVLALVAALWFIGALTQPRRAHGKKPGLATSR